MTALAKTIPTAAVNLTPQAIEPLAVDAATAAAMFGLSLRTWRRFDSSGRCPRGHRLGGRKVWLLSDLRVWAELGFPDRREFLSRLGAEKTEVR